MKEVLNILKDATVYGLVFTAIVLWAFNGGVEAGLANAPEFDASAYSEIDCNNVVAEDGVLKCEVFMQEEDDNIRIFKGATK